MKEIGCESAWAAQISPLFRAIERLLPGKSGEICPRPAGFSLRFFKSDWLLALILLISGFVYVGNAWTPSSYALALNIFQVSDDGLIAGKARAIRSDEWAVLTPLTQATINNHFERYNKTSFYGEDLRMMFSLPVFDWGMLFKPSMWLYFVVKPAYAFSFHHFATIVLFVIGYMQLFKLAGGTRLDSFLLSLTLFFTSFTQFWWTTLGPVLAFFPWLIVVLCQEVRTWIKLLGFYWIATCWFLSFFYPPIVISLSFVGLIFLFAFKPTFFNIRAVFQFGLAGLAAVTTACWYLKDYLLVTWNTLYPGRRNFGGGAVPFDEWLSQFLPTANLHHVHGSLIGQNICEIGTVGTYYILLVLCFLRFPSAKELVEKKVSLRPMTPIMIGLLMVTAWMLLPLPPWLGAPLLWNQVHPERMEYASGILLILLPFIAANKLGFEVSWRRFTFFGAAILCGWYYAKALRGYPNILETWYDIIIIPVILLILLLYKKIPYFSVNTLFLGASMLFSAAAFGPFNPLQSARPIFEREHTGVNVMLDSQAAADHTLAVGGFPGAVLNGWGYRSVSHVNTTPQLDVWKKIFSSLPESEINQIFNRYAHVILTDDPAPHLIQADAVAVPKQAFQQQENPSEDAAFRGRLAQIGYNGPLPNRVEGHVDTIEVDGSSLKITGWAAWKHRDSPQTLHLLSTSPTEIQRLTTIMRPDVARHLKSANYIASGFSIELTMPAPVDTKDLQICIVATDSTGNAARLYNAFHADACTKLLRTTKQLANP